MKGCEGRFIGVWGNHTVGKVWFYCRKKAGLEGLFFITRA